MWNASPERSAPPVTRSKDKPPACLLTLGRGLGVGEENPVDWDDLMPSREQNGPAVLTIPLAPVRTHPSWPAARLPATSSVGDGIMGRGQGDSCRARIAQRLDRRIAEARLRQESAPVLQEPPATVLTPPAGGSFLRP